MVNFNQCPESVRCRELFAPKSRGVANVRLIHRDLKPRFREFYLLKTTKNKGVVGAGVSQSSWNLIFLLVAIEAREQQLSFVG